MSRYTVLFTPRAERQLSDLYAYVANDSGEQRAEKFVGAIIDDCLALATFPERGSKREDIRPSLRTKGYARRVTIAFSIDVSMTKVPIHGVFYGGQDFEKLLRDNESDD